MPAPEELLISLTGHPAALNQTLGCATRIFNIFEGHSDFMGRRSSSKRIAIDSGHSQLRTQTASHPNHHDRRHPISSMDDRHNKMVQSTSRHHKSYSDIGDFAATPSRAFAEFRTSNGDIDTIAKPAYSEGTRSAYSEPKPAFSEGTVDALAFYNYNEPLQAAAHFAGDSRRRRSDLDHRDYIKRSFPSPQRVSKATPAYSDHPLQQQYSSSSEIRDAVLANFSGRQDSDQALQRESESRHLPRSIAVYARGLEPSELLHWKDGLRSSVSPPRRVARDNSYNCTKSPNRSSSGTTRMIIHQNSPEKRVEPRIRDRGRSRSRDDSFGNISPKKLFGEATLGAESPGASEFRESLRPFMTLAPARKSFASRLTDASGGSNQESRESTSVNVIARLMGLEEIHQTPQTSSKASSKVSGDAKSKGEKFFRGLVQFDPQTTMRASSPPPPCQSKKHHLGQRCKQENMNHGLQGDQYLENYPAQYKMEKGLCYCEEDRDYEHLLIAKMPFLPTEDDSKGAVTRPLEYVKDGLPPKLLANDFQAENAKLDAPEVSPSRVKQSTHKKKMLWKILEAMRPKVLLKISRRKHVEPEIIALSTENVVQTIPETQQQDTRVSFGSKLSSGEDQEEPSTYTNLIKQVQVQEQQTESNSTESSIVKNCIDETVIVVEKPVDRFLLSSEESQVSNADVFQIRQVETSSSNSNDEEKCPAMRANQINNEDCNPAHYQGNSIKSGVVVETTPRSGSGEGTLESDCETDPSSTTQHDKSDTDLKSRTTRTTTSRPNSSSRSPTPDIQRMRSSPEVHPSLSRSLIPSKDHNRGAGRKTPFANGRRDGRPAPGTPKAQIAKEEILKRRVNESSVASRLRGSSLQNESAEKFVGKETFSIRAPGALARSRSAVRLKQANEGTKSLGVPLKEVDCSRPAAADPVTSDESSGSNSDAQMQPASAQVQPSYSEPVMEHRGEVKGPNLGSFERPLVCELSEVQPEAQPEAQPEVQKHERVCASDPCESSAQLSNSGTCDAIPSEPQTLVQIQEASKEASEELTTPRGVRLNFEKLDTDKIAEAMDRPSPVSVLDANPFDEDLPLSPTSSSKHNVVPIHDSVATYNDERLESCVKDLEEDQYTSSATIEDDLDSDVSCNTKPEEMQAQVESSTETEIVIKNVQSYFKDAEPDEVKTFQESFSPTEISKSDESHDKSVMNSCVSDKLATKQQSTMETINENLLRSLHSNGIFQENDHVLLLNCLEEIMERMLESQSDVRLLAGLQSESICEIPKGKQLEHELWIEMQNMKRSSSSSDSQDICESVHNMLLQNLLRCQGRQWSTFHADREIIGQDMESMIVGDLIEEAVGELCALQCNKLNSLPLETIRRQLFAN